MSEKEQERFVKVERVALQPDEELWDYVEKVISAVHSGALSEFDIAPGDARLIGIFDKSVVVKDMSKQTHTRLNVSRSQGGAIIFKGPAVLVKRKWVPVESEAAVSKALGETKPEVGENEKLVEDEMVPVNKDVWGGLLTVMHNPAAPTDESAE